jgi:hypothetical protein
MKGWSPVRAIQCFGAKTATRTMKGTYVNNDTTAIILHLLLHDFASTYQRAPLAPPLNLKYIKQLTMLNLRIIQYNPFLNTPRLPIMPYSPRPRNAYHCRRNPPNGEHHKAKEKQPRMNWTPSALRPPYPFSMRLLPISASSSPPGLIDQCAPLKVRHIPSLVAARLRERERPRRRLDPRRSSRIPHMICRRSL